MVLWQYLNFSSTERQKEVCQFFATPADQIIDKVEEVSFSVKIVNMGTCRPLYSNQPAAHSYCMESFFFLKNCYNGSQIGRIFFFPKGCYIFFLNIE